MSPGLAYILMLIGFAVYLGVLTAAPRLGRQVIWTAIVLAVAAFAVAPVLLSHDVYSYLDYARLGVVHGLDPYAHPPSAAPTDPVYRDVEWTDATSAYGPLFTLLTYPLAWLPIGTAVAALKVLAAGSVLVLAWLVAPLAAARGLDPTRAAAFVALNPLVLVHVVGGAHNDGLAILAALVGVASLLAARKATAGAAFVAAAAIKASTAVVAPFALLAAMRPAGRFLAGTVTAIGAIALAAWFAFGWDWLSAFGLAGENQDRTSHMSVPVTAARILGLDADPVRALALVLYAALVLYLLAWTWRGGDWLRARSRRAGRGRGRHRGRGREHGPGRRRGRGCERR
ncbi:MAG TPA: polyprenol phosphomannose-dependent alpha 1,6 mannosyltransferase MptB [Solirubrobacterales bacterium]|nr:polyprenol phosphomannose-dependent alpha 1,6 mannosyltransferase MptB [Solirubrobacterales bacterium]